MEQPKRVLIVDDRRAVRQGLQALLALWPDVTCVGEAADGQEGLERVAEQRPDVVLMDIWMRGMDGLEATRRIKSQWPEVRIVVLTLRAEYEAKALAAGANAFLVKGGPPEALREAICRASTPGDGEGGMRTPGTDAHLRRDLSGPRSSMRSHRLRRGTGERPADRTTRTIPRYAGIPFGMELA